MTSDYRIEFADQFGIACVSVENPDAMDPTSLIELCIANGAVRNVDGEEFCAELRDAGPELWTEDALRRSVGKGL